MERKHSTGKEMTNGLTSKIVVWTGTGWDEARTLEVTQVLVPVRWVVGEFRTTFIRRETL